MYIADFLVNSIEIHEAPRRPLSVRPLWILISMIILAFCAIFSAPNPMICSVKGGNTLWKFPPSVKCSNAIEEIDSTSPVENVPVQIYRKNVVTFTLRAYLCKRIKQRVRLRTRFFGSHNEEVTTEKLQVARADCLSMINNKRSLDGTLRQNGAVLRTQNVLDKSYIPWTKCCRFFERSVVNSILFTGFVYKGHGQGKMESSLTDVKGCQYRSQECQQSDGSLLRWTINRT